MSRVDVVISERLGGIGPEESRIAQEADAAVRGAPLWSLEEIVRGAGAAEIIMVGAIEPFDRATLASLPACRAVVRRGVGFDNIDVDAATDLGILVANVPDASVEEVSDHALALLLTLERRVGSLDEAVRAGLWQRDMGGMQARREAIRRLSELTLAVVDFGRIGQALARKARPLYAEMLAVDPVIDATTASGSGARLVSFDEALERADHFSLHAPLMPSTHHLISAASLARMRPGAILVNTARGGLVDEEALVAALEAGRLAAAGLDVTDQEPLPPGHPLFATRAILTAHSASWSSTARAELARRSVDEVIRIANGRRPASIVNPEVLSRRSLRLTHLRER